MIIGLLVILLLAIFFDITRYKIPNACIVAALAVMATLVGILNGPPAAFISIVKSLCVIVLFFPVYLFGAIGAGDLKLMAVMGMALEIKDMFYLLWIAFCIAIILGFFKVILKKSINKSFLSEYKFFKLLFENKVNENSLRSRKLIIKLFEIIERRLIGVLNDRYFKVVNYFVLLLKKSVLRKESYSIHFSIALLLALIWIKM